MNIFNLFTISRYKKSVNTIPKIEKHKGTIFISEERYKLAAYIKRLRIKRGHSQVELAWIAGMCNSGVSRIERGHVPLTDKMARKLGRALRVDLIKKQKELEG